jgi:hypothetical protein
MRSGFLASPLLGLLLTGSLEAAPDSEAVEYGTDVVRPVTGPSSSVFNSIRFVLSNHKLLLRSN